MKMNQSFRSPMFFQSLAHEIGHNAGMKHDFELSRRNNRYDSLGKRCTDIGSIMDYFQTRTKWSTCSNEDFQESYHGCLEPKGKVVVKENENGTITTVAPLPKTTSPPLYKKTVPPLYKTTVPILHKTTVPPLHKTTVPTSYKTTVPPLQKATEPPLHKTTVPTLYKTTVPPFQTGQARPIIIQFINNFLFNPPKKSVQTIQQNTIEWNNE